MTFKSQDPSRNDGNSSVGSIVFLMMALVFVPIMAVHVALAWQDQLADFGPQQLAAIVNMILPAL